MTARSAARLALATSALACAALPACATTTTSVGTAESTRATLDPDVAAAIVAQGGLGPRGDSDGRGVVAPYLKAEIVAPGDKVKLDGVLGEWSPRTRADTVVQGAGARDGLSFNVGVRYDATNLYVGGEVTTAALHRTPRFAEDEDHASLVIAFGAGSPAVAAYEVNLYAGKPGETTGQVRLAKARGPLRGAQIVEAPANGGYSFEASIPWSTFPEARTTRIGLRAAVRYYEKADDALRIVATGVGDAKHPDDLAALPTEPEQSLDEGFLKEQSLRGQTPAFDLVADLTGDAMKERVQVWGSMLTVCGPTYRGGKDFFYRDLGGTIVRVEARPVARRAKDDLVIVRRVSDGPVSRDYFEVLSFLGKDDPDRVFGQEIAVVQGEERVDDAVHAVAGQIEVTPLPAHGWDATSYRQPTTTDVAPVLLPWGRVRSQTFHFDGARFTVARQVAQPGVATPSVPPDASSPPPSLTSSLPTSAPDAPPASVAALLEQFKRDHRIPPRTAPQADLHADLDGDGREEHVALLARDLVVTGPSLGGGRAYTSLTLEQFAAPGDIHEVTARDLTGQGAAHIVVRGTRHVTAGRGATVDEEALFIYALRGTALTRVFGIETARAQAGRRVQGLVQFVPSRSGKGFDVDVRPGRAVGWTRGSYPWPQDSAGTGSLEPLLLPWGPVTDVRYAWDGSRFAN